MRPRHNAAPLPSQPENLVAAEAVLGGLDQYLKGIDYGDPNQNQDALVIGVGDVLSRYGNIDTKLQIEKDADGFDRFDPNSPYKDGKKRVEQPLKGTARAALQGNHESYAIEVSAAIIDLRSAVASVQNGTWSPQGTKNVRENLIRLIQNAPGGDDHARNINRQLVQVMIAGSLVRTFQGKDELGAQTAPGHVGHYKIYKETGKQGIPQDELDLLRQLTEPSDPANHHRAAALDFWMRNQASPQHHEQAEKDVVARQRDEAALRQAMADAEEQRKRQFEAPIRAADAAEATRDAAERLVEQNQRNHDAQMEALRRIDEEARRSAEQTRRIGDYIAWILRRTRSSQPEDSTIRPEPPKRPLGLPAPESTNNTQDQATSGGTRVIINEVPGQGAPEESPTVRPQQRPATEGNFREEPDTTQPRQPQQPPNQA